MIKERISIGMPCLYNGEENVKARTYRQLESFLTSPIIKDCDIVFIAQEWPIDSLDKFKKHFEHAKNLRIIEKPKAKIAPDIRIMCLEESSTDLMYIADSDVIFRIGNSKFDSSLENGLIKSIEAFDKIEELVTVCFIDQPVPEGFGIAFSNRTCSGHGKVYHVDRVLNTEVLDYYRLIRNIEDCALGAAIANSGKLSARYRLKPLAIDVTGGSTFNRVSFGVPKARRMDELYCMFGDLDSLKAEYAKLAEKYSDSGFKFYPKDETFCPGAWNLKSLARVAKVYEEIRLKHPNFTRFEITSMIINKFFETLRIPTIDEFEQSM